MLALHISAPLVIPQRAADLQIWVASAHAGGDDLDFAVFRFTLGIPGFNDDNIPRLVGAFGVALLVANHIFAGASISDAQVGLRPGVDFAFGWG